MYAEDAHDEILRTSAELRARLFGARAESARIVAISKRLVTEIADVRASYENGASAPQDRAGGLPPRRTPRR